MFLCSYYIIFLQAMCLALLKILAIILVGTAMTVYIFFAPHYASELSYHGETASIRRDANNIPTITASSRTSYMYAIGRVHAEDRLFQMSFKRLVVQGRLAEYLGEKPLPMDKFMRELNLKGWGQRMAERLQRENITEYQQFQGYVDGINKFVAGLTILPFDFQLLRYRWENWTVADVMGQYKLLQWSQSMSLAEEYTRSALLARGYTKEEVGKFMPATKENWAFGSTAIVEDSLIPEKLTTEFLKKNQKNQPTFSPQITKQYQELGLFDLLPTLQGSNWFVIAGKNTASGQPILVNDPHLENVMPSQWYQTQAVYTHNNIKHSISGISCTGVPFIIGKSDYYAVGVTTIYTDNQDLYRETVEGDKYLVNGKWHDLAVREERIKVKTDKGVVEEAYKIRETHRGPLIHYIIASLGSYGFQDNLSLSWTGFIDEYAPIILASHLPQTKSFNEAKELLLRGTEFFFNVNIGFMTSDGHIGYQQLGRYPIRANPESGLFIKDGSTTDHDWRGFVPPGDRLQIIDPPSGYIVSANNRIASANYYNGLHAYNMFTARSDRLHQILSEGIAKGHKYTVEDAKKIVTDTVDVYCIQMQSYLKASIPQASSALEGFDCDFKPESTQATMYENFFYQLHHLAKPHNAEKMSIMSLHSNAQYLFNYIKDAVREQEKAEIVRSAWRKMKVALGEHFKNNDTSAWKWGQFHKDVMHHMPFSQSPLSFLYDRAFPGYGNMHTVNVGKMNKVEFGNFETSHRANYRVVHSFAGDSYWIIDSGSSEKLFSAHYDDQWELFRRNQFLPIRDPRFPYGSAQEL